MKILETNFENFLDVSSRKNIAANWFYHLISFIFYFLYFHLFGSHLIFTCFFSFAIIQSLLITSHKSSILRFSTIVYLFSFSLLDGIDLDFYCNSERNYLITLFRKHFPENYWGVGEVKLMLLVRSSNFLIPQNIFNK